MYNALFLFAMWNLYCFSSIKKNTALHRRAFLYVRVPNYIRRSIFCCSYIALLDTCTNMISRLGIGQVNVECGI